MKVQKYHSSKIVSIPLHKFKLDWDNDGASSLEVRFRELVKPYWQNSIILYQFMIPGSLMRIDFLNVNKRLAIETSGEQHNKFNPFFHKNSRANYLASIKRDSNKQEWCELNDIKFMELYEEDLDNFSRDYILNKFGIDIF